MIHIRRYALVSTILTLIFSTVGAVLRKIELRTVFDSTTGLAEPWAPISIALIAFSVGVVLILFVLSLRLRKLTAGDGYASVFGTKSPIPYLLTMLVSAALAVASVTFMQGTKVDTARMVLAMLGVFAAVSAIVVSFRAYRGSNGGETMLCSIIIVAFLSFFMVLEYKARSADPVVLDYMYEFLALCASVLAFFYVAGFAYDKPRPAQTAAFCQIAVYFSCVSMMNIGGWAQMAVNGFCAVVLLVDGMSMTANLKPKEA